MTEREIDKYLPLVRKPSRYIGGEVNSVLKDIDQTSLSFALCFPDVYDIGISHLGLQILYQILNARDDIACERAFAPWKDFEALLREKKALLTTLESKRALSEFDIVGFSLQYELTYTNILNMLELGGITLLSAERTEDEPIIIGGGPVAFNPEPVADFFDAFLLGDGEEAIVEIADVVIETKKSGLTKKETLERLASIEGVYIPSFFELSYKSDGTIDEIAPLKEGYEKVGKRILRDLNSAPLPTKPVVPFTEAVHDRLSVEIARGCTRGCRFCHAGMVYRPARERDPEEIIKLVTEGLANTGYDEVSLLSLSTGDYCQIEPLLTSLMDRLAHKHVAVSFPSLRIGTLSKELAEQIKRVRKTGFTLAPEAGTERLRSVINKPLKEEELVSAAKNIYTLGWSHIKLYFMIGMPTETAEDIDGIVRISKLVATEGGWKERSGPRKFKGKGRGRKGSPVNVSIGGFVPKPFTPFQWEPQIGLEETLERQRNLKENIEGVGIGFKWHDARMTLLEGVFSRGDRRLSAAILRAFKDGARFDGWGEEFDFALWERAMKASDLAIGFYATRRRALDEILPWDHLDPGIDKDFLIKELADSKLEAFTPDCKVDRCTDCGVCDHKDIKNISFKEPFISKAAQSRGPQVAEITRIRLGFEKRGLVRFIGHLELKETMTRALRRAQLPLRYSGGFHPMPKLSFSNPLPVGVESLDEYLDIELKSEVLAANLPERLNNTLPIDDGKGLKVTSATPIALQVASLSAKITAIEYLINVKFGPLSKEGLRIELESLENFTKSYKELETIIVTIRRKDKSKEVDIKPLLKEFSIEDDGLIKLVLTTPEGPGVKPHELLSHITGLSTEVTSLIPILKTRTVL